MNELHNHELCVILHPFDKVAALSLVDHIQEGRGRSRREALREVAILRKPGQDAEYLARAARVMRCRTVAKMQLEEVIKRTAKLELTEEATIYLVRGFQLPVRSAEDRPMNWDERYPVSIYVGARWVTHTYRQLVRENRRWQYRYGRPHRRK